jgi:pimeloyl-ACP methyl ester carboxylesterase
MRIRGRFAPAPVSAHPPGSIAWLRALLCSSQRSLLGIWMAGLLLITPLADAVAGPAEEVERELEGRGEREIVLVHGLGSSAEVWDGVLPYLRGSHKVWVYELPGHGHTQPVRGATIDNLATDLGRFLQESDVAYPVLVGHGMGGLICMRYTFDNPADVRRLIVIDAAPKQLASDEQKSAISRQILEDYDQFVAIRYLNMSPYPDITDRIVDQALKTDSVTFVSLLMSSFDFDVTEELSRQAVPILVVGSHMFFPDPENAMAHLDAMGYAEARTISFKHVSHTGHFIMLERPVYLASIILAYCISRHDR